MLKKIAIISKSDTTGGGASRIAAGLCKLLNTVSNIEAHHWVGLPGPNTDWYTRKLHGGRWLSLIQGAFAVTSRFIGFPDFFTPELIIHFLSKKVDYDLYHFHDISFTFSPIALNWLSKRKPVIWTFHDCSPFTGGCIAPMDCKAFLKTCNHCPKLSELPLGTKIDMTRSMQAFKKRILNKNLIVPVTPSNWLRQEFLDTVQPKIYPQIIPNFVDDQTFIPLDHQIIRKILNLPLDRFIVLLTSTSLTDQHKGLKFGLSALNKINPKPYILAIGKADKKLGELFSGFDFYSTGYIYNDRLLAQYYAAADVFLFPTLADSFGLVAIEAMACGTPCIAFATGGVPEIIDHNITGWLVQQKDIEGLVQGLRITMSDKKRLETWAINGRKKAEEKFNPAIFLKKHLNLYEELLDFKL